MNHEEQEDGILKVLRVGASREAPGALHTSRDALSRQVSALRSCQVLLAAGSHSQASGT